MTNTVQKPILTVENLQVTFQNNGAIFEAVKDLSFQVSARETLAIVGESGSGKSVSALSILKLLPYPMASHPRGKIIFDGRDILALPSKELLKIRGSKISMIFQEPMTSLNPLHTIERQIAEVLMLHQGFKNSEACRPQIVELMKMVGFTNIEERLNAYPHQLSGGQRQRIMIAIALACRPKLLIADEPTTAVDVTTQAYILDLMRELQKEIQMSLILITHDLGVVKKMADRVVVMQRGEMVESATTTDIFRAPKADYTKSLIAALPSGRPEPLSQAASTVLEVKDMSVRFKTKTGLLSRSHKSIDAVLDASFLLKESETLGVVGESGSGKTTLAMAVLQLQSYEGDVTFEGKSLQGLSSKVLQNSRRRMQIVFQDPFGSLSPRMTVRDIVGEGLKVHEKGLSREEVDRRIESALLEVGLDPSTSDRYPHEFSGGQRQRISIARALILKPRLVVLDEPTSALDRAVQRDVLNLLRELQRKHRLSYLFISHDLSVVRAMSHRILVMKEGRIVESGETEHLFSNAKNEYTRLLLKASLFVG